MSIIEKKEKNLNHLISKLNSLTLTYSQPKYEVEKIKTEKKEILRQKTELEKRITEWESKMKQQQALYEQVRADRNSFSKSLIESQDEIAEMRKKFKIMDHQIEQLKGEIVSKDQALVKEHFDVQRAEKQKEYINKELARKNSLIKQNHELAQHQDGEIRRLTGIIRKLDDEALSQRKDYDQIINERDILGTQLIRRNDELALLREKLRVQQSALKNGEMQYNARVTPAEGACLFPEPFYKGGDLFSFCYRTSTCSWIRIRFDTKNF